VNGSLRLFYSPLGLQLERSGSYAGFWGRHELISIGAKHKHRLKANNQKPFAATGIYYNLDHFVILEPYTREKSYLTCIS